MKTKYVVTYYSYLSNIYCVYNVGFNTKKEAENTKRILRSNGHTNIKVEKIQFAN